MTLFHKFPISSPTSYNGRLRSKKTFKKKMENMYTQAIADAKAVRESAMANAKAAIQEAFEPKIKAMLKKHIVESEEEMDEAEHIVHTKKSARSHAAGFHKSPAPKGAIEDLEEEYEEMEEGHYEDEMEEGYHDEEEMDEAEYASEMDEEDPGNLDEKYLDEILDELESMDESEEELEESQEEELDETKELEESEEEMDEAKEEEEESEEEGEEEDGEETPESSEETKVVDITLGDLVDAIKAAMAGGESAAPEAETGSEDEVSLDEILAELEDESEEDEMDEAKKMEEAKKKKMEEKKELEEAKKAIKSMQKELNEINLLNAKLLYVNKIFKSKSLTEAQKVKVLNAFDKATTVKEAKNTYKIISESITAAPKKTLKESYGFASKPSGVAPKTNTLESDPFIARMQKLAGL